MSEKNNSRRRFLRNSLLAGLGAGAGPFAFQNKTFSIDKAPDVVEQTSKNGRICILQTTDVHCQIHPHDELFWEKDQMVFRKTAGYAHLATLFEEVRKENPHTFIVDTGDMFQGSELSVKTTGKAMQPILNAMGYDLYLPGNWEVIYYKKNMQTLLGGLDAPKVCANMYHDLGEGKKGELIFPPYFTWSKLGVKIGFLGYTDPLVPIRQPPACSKGIVYTKPEENLPYYVQVLREQEQCDFIILLSHLGLSQQIALSNMPECAGVDYIFGGDTHERVRTPIEGKYCKVVEPGAFGSFVGQLEIEVEDGKIKGSNYQLLEVNPEKYKPHAKVAGLIKDLEAPFVQEIETVAGYSKVPLYRYFVVENTIDTFIVDALAWKVPCDVVFSNGFRFCPPRSTPNADGLIPITEGYIFDMLPWDSNLRIGKVKGAQLLSWLEKELNNVFSKDASKRLGGWVVKMKGMKLKFNAFDEPGKRVKSVLIGGKPLETERMYSVLACAREGDPQDTLCRIQHVDAPEDLPLTLHAVLKEYLAANSPVNPIPRGDVQVLDAPQGLLSQVSGVPYSFR